MRNFLPLLAAVALVGFAGCGDSHHEAAKPEKTVAIDVLPKQPAADDPLTAEELEIIKKLPVEDQKLAIDQKVCPIGEGHLGDPGMGAPVKLMVKGTPVFICCEGCRAKVEKDPEGTLAKLAALKSGKQ